MYDIKLRYLMKPCSTGTSLRAKYFQCQKFDLITRSHTIFNDQSSNNVKTGTATQTWATLMILSFLYGGGEGENYKISRLNSCLKFPFSMLLYKRQPIMSNADHPSIVPKFIVSHVIKTWWFKDAYGDL